MAEIVGILVGCIIAAVSFKPLFGSFDDFFDCIKFWFKPDIFSAFDGQFWEDMVAEFKLGVWLLFSVGSGYLSYRFML